MTQRIAASFPVKDLEVIADAAQYDVRDRGRVHNPQLQ
jgi:hypothetical protein